MEYIGIIEYIGIYVLLVVIAILVLRSRADEDYLVEMIRRNAVTAKEVACEVLRQQKIESVVEEVREAEREFLSHNPDYYGAVVYLRRALRERAKLYTIEGGCVESLVQGEVARLTAEALRNGESPALAAYKKAIELGYEPPEAG